MNKLYFLWDYNLNKKQVKNILHSRNDAEKSWLIARILTHAQFKDVWKYLTINDIVKIFPKLHLPTQLKQAWQRALNVWGYHV